MLNHHLKDLVFRYIGLCVCFETLFSVIKYTLQWCTHTHEYEWIDSPGMEECSGRKKREKNEQFSPSHAIIFNIAFIQWFKCNIRSEKPTNANEQK